jgi:hypothetical protein
VTGPPEPCVFVVWSTARTVEERILADLRRRFRLLDVREIAWPTESFARNLTRLYGTALESGSDKERQVGAEPFLVVVALDERPRYGLRRTSRGLRRVNVRTAAAKRRYRRWAGPFRVHGSLDAHEAKRDLRLLLGRDPRDLGGGWDGTIRLERRDETTGRWPALDQLVTTIGSATHAAFVGEAEGRLVVETDDVWWAAVIAGAPAPADDPSELDVQLDLGGRPRVVRFRRALHARA